MSIAGLPAVRGRRHFDDVAAWWRAVSPRTRSRILLAILGVSVVFAYHYSLSTLLQNLNSETPLAYTGLVPLIAAGLAAIRARPLKPEPNIHDRQLDWIVGLPLLATALAIEFVLPHKMSTLYWLWRIDLLGLPLFVAGAVALLFGTRVLWRQRLAISYLIFAWPYPYNTLLNRVLNSFTNLTISTTQKLVHLDHVATPVPGPDNTLFQIVHHGKPFVISVVSACSGINSVVGFLLVGVAFGAIVTGPRLRKTLWLVGGMLLLWAFNLGRLMFIFWVGRVGGEHLAINVFHPFIGLVTFNLGIIIMILALRPLGLRIDGLARTHLPAAVTQRSHSTPKVLTAVAVVGLLGIATGIHNSTLSSYDLVASASGEPKLGSYSVNPAAPPGWRVSYTATYDWAKPYFGANSSWIRFSYSATNPHAKLYSSFPLTADVVNTTSLQSFTNYGVEACYQFHGYTLKDISNVSLGGGITGQTLSYHSSRYGNWSVIYWIWPVKPATSGGTIHYERVIIYLLNSGTVTLHAPGITTGVKSYGGAGLAADSASDRSLIQSRTFLIDFARQVVTIQADAKHHSGVVIPTTLASTASGSPAEEQTASSSSRTSAEVAAQNAQRHAQATKAMATVHLP